MTGTAIKTNGEGKPCTSHLNLTRTMEGRPHLPEVHHQPYSRQLRPREYQAHAKIPFAGHDRADKEWKA